MGANFFALRSLRTASGLNAIWEILLALKITAEGILKQKEGK